MSLKQPTDEILDNACGTRDARSAPAAPLRGLARCPGARSPAPLLETSPLSCQAGIPSRSRFTNLARVREFAVATRPPARRPARSGARSPGVLDRLPWTATGGIGHTG